MVVETQGIMIGKKATVPDALLVVALFFGCAQVGLWQKGLQKWPFCCKMVKFTVDFRTDEITM